MKRVKVLSFEVDLEYLHPEFTKQTIESWIKTEEGKFIERHSTRPIEMRVIKKLDLYVGHYELWATLEEKYEMFWRLKFK
jgi:hypothetical protein